MIPMKQTPLSQLATVSAGQAAPKDDEFSDGGIPFVRAGSLDGLLSGKSESDLELVSDETAKLRKLKTYPKGTILFAKSGMSATKDRIYVLQTPAYVVSHLATLIPNGNVQSDYLRLALKRFPPSVLINDPAYPAISLSDIQSYEIPVPEHIDDQIRIAHLLGKVEGLIAQRKQHLQQLDDLLKSVFLEMFGDPVRNEKGWNVVYWDDLFVTRTGKLNANAMSENGAYPFFTCAKEIFQIDCFAFDCEALILAGNNATGDYDVKYHKGKFNAYQRTYILELKTDTDKYPFFKHHLEMKLRQLKDGSKGANTRYLTKLFLDTIVFIQPGEGFQMEFSVIAKKIEGLKSRYHQSLADLEALYGTLSQQAFKGELDLSRVPLPVDLTMEDTESTEGVNRETREQRENWVGRSV